MAIEYPTTIYRLLITDYIMKAQPDWLNKTLYPFDSHWMELDGHQLHYLDEGQGKTIVFVHGTPEWSFGFRDLIKALRSHFRCVAIDLLGFGLSDKPAAADYSCQGHAGRLEKFIQHLNLKNFSLVANDFGGGIGLSYVLRHPANIDSIILFNTWMWSVKEDPHYAGPAKVINSWLGKWLYLYLNFPVNTIMPSAYGDKKKLTKEVHRHYKKALPSADERTAAYAFAKELMNASPWWQSLWGQIHTIRQKPVLIFWGLKDKFIQPYELEKWKGAFPQAKVITFPDAGHFVQEEKPEEMVQAMRDFI